jgi:2-polyprenyl-3-methyl-5-hydroxy-6-metoxy-1,4-benzoquinol methylase
VRCRHCKSPLIFVLVDLGTSPPSNAYLTDISLRRPEKYFPLRVLVCEQCWLVQAEDYSRAAELFNDEYAYFSSFSNAWLEHSKNYVASVVDRFDLDGKSFVVEVASNDGYLLQYFKSKGIPCLGIEPTASTANAARLKGIETIERFFGVEHAKELVAKGIRCDLMVANNVLAHVPEINDFVEGFEILLSDNGVATFEFPHLLKLISENQFDTVYHEHFSYLSFTTVCEIFEKCGLKVFDVQDLSTHGGSLRVFAQKMSSGTRMIEQSVMELINIEKSLGMKEIQFYEGFQLIANRVKDDFVEFLISAKRSGKKVFAYGAAAKGNTLINYSGIRGDLIQAVVDRNPAKQGKFLPGSRIPIVSEDELKIEQPDYIVILPWNLRQEITEQLSYCRAWGAKFVVAVPSVQVQ